MKETSTVAKKIDKIIFRFMWVFAVLAGASLIFIAVLATANAVGSKVFSKGITNATELVTYFNIPVVFLAMGFLQVERGNTVVDFFLGKFPKVVQLIIITIGRAAGVAICAYTGYASLTLAIDKFQLKTRAAAAANSFYVWPFAMVVAFGLFMMAFAFLWTLIREFIIPEEERCGYVPTGGDDAYQDPEGIDLMGTETRLPGGDNDGASDEANEEKEGTADEASPKGEEPSEDEKTPGETGNETEGGNE